MWFLIVVGGACNFASLLLLYMSMRSANFNFDCLKNSKRGISKPFLLTRRPLFPPPPRPRRVNERVNFQVILVNADDGHLRGECDADAESGVVGSNEQAKRQRASLLLELQAMMRLRSPHTVNVYGAITSLKDKLVLVMELLTGGDLRSLLKHSKERIPEPQARRIIQDVCAGITFLHSKRAVHGDLKSANVLLDGEGRAKVSQLCVR